MIRNDSIGHQNALAMFLASALITGFISLNVCHFEYLQGVNAFHKRTG
jgi:hypothetical protein